MRSENNKGAGAGCARPLGFDVHSDYATAPVLRRIRWAILRPTPSRLGFDTARGAASVTASGLGSRTNFSTGTLRTTGRSSSFTM